MVHHKHHAKIKLPKLTPLLAASVIVVSSIAGPALAHADRYDEQIKALEKQRSANQGAASGLAQQAQGIQGEIDVLQVQITSIQAQIDLNTARQNELNQQIEQAKKKLAEQRDLLSASIRSMYIEGDITPLEMIASSKNLSDFVDKQEYRDRIKENITKTMDEIERLKQQLDARQKEVTRILDDQKALRGGLDQKNAEAAAKLASVNQSKAGFDAQIRAQSAEIAALRAQQRAANVEFITGTGVNCGGGYPGSRNDGHKSYNGGYWGCNYGLDQGVDAWGMFNRECVSYTAFKVAESGRHMPYWGGNGNAWKWAYDNNYGGAVGGGGNAGRAGIPTDGNPRAGDVAISNKGEYGHAMYVEAVLGGGKILISQYNAGWDGRYSEKVISAAGLRFIHF